RPPLSTLLPYTTLFRSGNSPSYDVTVLGYNYRMDEFRAAIGLIQLMKLGSWNEKRKTLAKIYRRHMEEFCPDVGLPFAAPRPSSDRKSTRLNSSHQIIS